MRSFQRLAVATTVLTYALIAVGGLVRASGAGLGCPDWPRCFGSWVPPASAADLPPQFDATQFNATLMWTEYLNRLLGVSVGLAILATAVSAWQHHRHSHRVVGPVWSALLLTGFQGWLGGRVVAHELAPWIVTIHMLVALVIVVLLLWALVESWVAALPGKTRVNDDLHTLGWWATAAIALLMIEVAIGTQVRGGIDVALDLVPRSQALGMVGMLDATHRTVAAVVAGVTAALWIRTWTHHRANLPLVWAATAALICTVSQLVAGGVLVTYALPPAAQVLHLTLASLLLGALTVLALIAVRVPATIDPG